MKIDRIIYKRNFLLNPQTMEHQHIGVEVLLDEFDNIDEVYLKAKSKVEEWAKIDWFESAAKDWEEHLDSHGIKLPEIQVKESPIRHKIEDCNTLEELAALKKDLPFDLMKPYMNKLKELTELIK